MRALLTASLGVLAASVLVSCAGTPGSTPTSSPHSDGTHRVQTYHAATVLDDGDGPELCLGILLTSYPPQCGGPALIDWNWSDWAGHYERASGVRWGSFWVAGDYDPQAQTFTVGAAMPADEREWPPYEYDGPDFSTPCLTPDGGWQVADPARTTQETLDATLARAETLDGYAGAWIDQSINPRYGTEPTDDEDMLEQELSMNDPMLLILNVKTTGDVAETERALRETWGGMLCVSTGIRDEIELRRIQEEISTPDSGVLASWPDTMTGVVRVEVIFDDGTLQQRFDETYGDGVVEVSSVLVAWP